MVVECYKILDIVVYYLSLLWGSLLQLLIAAFVFFPLIAAGGWMGDAAVSCDLRLLGCQDGGDPSAFPPRPTGNYINT
jgi:hypothetical protein